jgi:hypothetical protein
MPQIEVHDDFLKYNPGSPGAVERGCRCPQAENNFGRGRSKNGVIEPLFTADPDCPIHGFDILLKMLEENNEDGSECEPAS